MTPKIRVFRSVRGEGGIQMDSLQEKNKHIAKGASKTDPHPYEGQHALRGAARPGGEFFIKKHDFWPPFCIVFSTFFENGESVK